MNRFFVERAIETDARESKLPAWAREKLTALRRTTTETLAEIDAIKAGGKPGPFWLESWENNARYYLPPEAGRLMFGDPNGEPQIMLAVDTPTRTRGFLNLNGQSGRGLVIAPWASNVVLVKVGDEE